MQSPPFDISSASGAAQAPAPDLGPRILIMSGGSAMRDVSRELKTISHRTTHVLTPFDSGGSSAGLREAFSMPSVGDLRNRLVALADESVPTAAATQKLLSHRLPADAPAGELARELQAILDGLHPLIAAIEPTAGEVIKNRLAGFMSEMPADFDLRGASIGNLVIAGSYLMTNRDLDAAVQMFAHLVGALGTVVPVTNESLHLQAEYDDGSVTNGQHEITHPRADRSGRRITGLRLIGSLADPWPARASLRSDIARVVGGAQLIVLSPGSFFTSLIANLLPIGVGSALVTAQCPRVYVPNLGRDPEQDGLTMADCVERIAETVKRDTGRTAALGDIVTHVLIDSRRGTYSTQNDLHRVASGGVKIVDTDLCDLRRPTQFCPAKLARALVETAS